MYIARVYGDDREEYLNRWEEEFDLLERDVAFSWGFDGRGQHYFNLHAFVLSVEEHQALEEAHKRVVELLHHIQSVVGRRPQVMQFLGIPESLWDRCLLRPLPYLTAMGRFDWHWTRQGPKLLEFNSETPFGQVEACYLQQRVAQVYHPNFRNPNEHLADTIGHSLRESFKLQGGHSSSVTAVVGFAADPEESSTLTAMRRIANYPGYVIAGDVQALTFNAEHRLCLGGAPIDLLQSFYSVEWYAKDRDGERFVRCLTDGSLRMLNPPSTLILHSKALFALIWLVVDQLPQKLRTTVENYIPYTSFDPEPLLGRPVMIKPLHNREGKGLAYSDSLTINEATREEVVYQERIDAKPVIFPVMRNGRVNERPLMPTIGTFCVADQMAGFYTRFGPLIVTPHEVCWAPTLVDRN